MLVDNIVLRKGLDGRVDTHQRVVAHRRVPHADHRWFIIKDVVFLAQPDEAARHNQTRWMVVSLKIVAQPSYLRPEF